MSVFRRTTSRFAAAVVLAVVISVPSWEATPVGAGTTEVDLGGDSLDFSEWTVVLSGDVLQGVDFPNVLDLGGPCIQAELRVTDTVNIAYFMIEEYDPDFPVDDRNPPISLYILGDDLDGDDAVQVDSSAHFNLDFLYSSDCSSPGVPITLLNVCTNVVDVDDRQFVSFDSPTSYQTSPNSVLETTTSGSVVTMTEPDGTSSDDDSDQNFWAEFQYASTNSIDFSVGIAQGGDGDASFDVVFECANWSSSTPFQGLDWSHYEDRAQEAAKVLPNTR